MSNANLTHRNEYTDGQTTLFLYKNWNCAEENFSLLFPLYRCCFNPSTFIDPLFWWTTPDLILRERQHTVRYLNRQQQRYLHRTPKTHPGRVKLAAGVRPLNPELLNSSI